MSSIRAIGYLNGFEQVPACDPVPASLDPAAPSERDVAPVHDVVPAPASSPVIEASTEPTGLPRIRRRHVRVVVRVMKRR